MLDLHCFVCEKELEHVTDREDSVQPYGAIMFESQGNYGSTVYDPMHEFAPQIILLVCDDCVRDRQRLAFSQKITRVRPDVRVHALDLDALP